MSIHTEVPASESNTLLPALHVESSFRGFSINHACRSWIGAVLSCVIVGGGLFWISSVPEGSSNQSSDLERHPKTEKVVVLQLEGNKNHHEEFDETVENTATALCEDGTYSKRTLQLAYEVPFASMFRDNKGARKFEASSVFLSDDKETVYAVCDSSWAISKFGIQLVPFSDTNSLVGEAEREVDQDSGYEAIFIDRNTFFVVRESIEHDESNDQSGTLDGYHAVVEEIVMSNDTYDVVRKCPAEFEFEGDSKGFEGAIAIHDLNNTLILLGLCEGNKCSEGSSGKEIGHGRIVVMRQVLKNDGSCLWTTYRTLHLPASAAFLDYSDISITSSGKVAVTSQENSQLWIGQLLGQNSMGLWDIDALEFDDVESVVYDFPKDNLCNTVYCNIEGIQWINDEMVIAVSDKMKGHGKQSFRCFEKDQSVHIFMLPES